MLSLRHTLYTILLALTIVTAPKNASAQNWDDVAFWTADLGLNVLQEQAAARELEEYRRTYVVIRDGYRIIRGLVSENHDLHKEFFDEMSSINPVVANYYKVNNTVTLARNGVVKPLRQLPQLLRYLRLEGGFTDQEIRFVQAEADGFLKRARQIVAEVGLVAIPSSGGDFQMMDSERIVLIDDLYTATVKMTTELKQFRRMLLQLAQRRQDNSTNALRGLFEVVRP